MGNHYVLLQEIGILFIFERNSFTMNPIPNDYILSKKRKCIINTDLDGILSGIILHNILEWEIVGFCDSGEYIWLDNSKYININEIIFIDMFVAPTDFKCIDQHIIAFDSNQHKLLASNPNKLNPNLLNERCLTPTSSYSAKYPFGTIHFIIASLERQGYEFDIKLMKEIMSGIKLIDIILRADDAMFTSTFSNYTDNAQYWWEWLINYSNNGKTTRQFYEYIRWAKSNLWLRQIKLQKLLLTDLLKSSPFYCSRSDGGYAGIEEMGNKKLKNYVKEYIHFMSEIVGLKCFNLEVNFSTIKGIAKRTTFSSKTQDEILANTYYFLFSYAYVRSLYRKDNFSYTLMPRKLLDMGFRKID